MAVLSKKDVKSGAEAIVFFSCLAAVAAFCFGFHYLPFITDIGLTIATFGISLLFLLILFSIGNTLEDE